MASSLSFQPSVRDLLPVDVLEKLRILPIAIKKDKLCLIARRPLTDNALMELKALTGFQDYELQLVGDDVIVEYLQRFINGSIFDGTWQA